MQWILGIGGIEVRHGQRLGHEISLEGLRQSHDAVFLGLGLGATNAPGLETAGITGVEDAVDFIAVLRQARDKSALPLGRQIIVIGGGMTAIDMATQARRLGAPDVTIAYRRGPAEMKASRYEQELALTNGVVIRHWLTPKALKAGADAAVQGVEFATGGEGETVTLPCDQLFLAIGQSLVTGQSGLALEQSRIRVDASRKTSLENVWAGGDCIAGGKDLTVSAVEDGKQAARAIDVMLRCSGGR